MKLLLEGKEPDALRVEETTNDPHVTSFGVIAIYGSSELVLFVDATEEIANDIAAIVADYLSIEAVNREGIRLSW